MADHLATMERAARDSDCGVPWQLLAAIARVESNFGRNMATSSAGAVGYGQFLPSSWQAFGSDGNVYDYRDALPAMALYLCQAGLARDPRAALFAYNHADWYVDLVLDLAVRYDRIAPGQPIPDVLGIGPPADAGAPMHYAAGRDLRLQSRQRRLDAGASWLGVPWHGRRPGAAISPASLEDTALEMIRGTFGLSGGLPGSSETAAHGFGDLANRAWAAGLLALPDPPSTPTLESVRSHLEHGQPVLALLDSKALPGHRPSDEGGDQPVVVIGSTATGLIVSDPMFASTLGYGLQLTDEEFLAAWKSASSPGQALAFSARPAPLARQAHLRTAEPPPVYARVAPTPTMTPMAAPTVTPAPAPSPSPAPLLLASAMPTPTPVAVTATRVDNRAADLSWLALVGSALFVAGAFVVRLARARRWAWPPGRAATTPRRSDQ